MRILKRNIFSCLWCEMGGVCRTENRRSQLIKKKKHLPVWAASTTSTNTCRKLKLRPPANASQVKPCPHRSRSVWHFSSILRLKPNVSLDYFGAAEGFLMKGTFTAEELYYKMHKQRFYKLNPEVSWASWSLKAARADEHHSLTRVAKCFYKTDDFTNIEACLVRTCLFPDPDRLLC